MLIGCGLVTIGTGLRLLDMSKGAAIYLVSACQIMNAAVGPVVLALPPVLSATWFPVEERTTATAITSLANSLGGAMAFALAPALVPDCDTISDDQIHSSLTKLYLCHFVWALITSVLAVAYFPAKPPTPPSESQSQIAAVQALDSDLSDSVEQPLIGTVDSAVCSLPKHMAHESTGGFEDSFEGIDSDSNSDASASADPSKITFGGSLLEFVEICKSPNFLLLVGTYGISAGVYCCWGSLLSLILKPKCCAHDGIPTTCPNRSCFGESEAAYIGLSSTLCSVIGGIMAARLADKLRQSHKPIIVVCFALACATFLGFTLSVEGIFAMNLVGVFLCVSLGGAFLASVQPMAYELAAEITYPVPEERSSTVLVIVYNAGALASMLAAQFIGTNIINWLLAITCGVCGALMILFKAEYKRGRLDGAP